MSTIFTKMFKFAMKILQLTVLLPLAHYFIVAKLIVGSLIVKIQEQSVIK